MKRPVVILFHLLYWLVYFSLLNLLFRMSIIERQHMAAQLLHWNTIMLGFAIIPGAIGFYSAYSILFRRLLTPRKIAWLMLAVAGVSVAATVTGEFLLYSYVPRKIHWSTETVVSMGIVMAMNVVLNSIAGLGLKGFITWYEELKWKEALSRRNYEMELALIRLQLSPHFLFNTINNIDVLIAQDAVRASAYLNKLSDIMRFMLYESKAELIPLQKELDYIEKYISLQRIRTANPDYIIYEVIGHAGCRTIPPMLLIPFIENAFKHSIPQKSGNAIRVTVLIEGGRLVFECVNSQAVSPATGIEHSGLGKELIEKRLRLLYDNQHQMQIEDDAGIYKVTLTIPLSEQS